MNSQRINWSYEIRRLFFPDSIKIVREHSSEDALLLIDRYYMNFRDHLGATAIGSKMIKDSWFLHSNEVKEGFLNFEDSRLRLVKFNDGLELFSYEERRKIYGAFCEYYYEIFKKRCESGRYYVLIRLNNDFIRIARLWGINNSEELKMFIENLTSLLEILVPCKATKRVFFSKVCT